MPYQEIQLDVRALSRWNRTRVEEIGRRIYREFIGMDYSILEFKTNPQEIPVSMIIVGRKPLPYEDDISDLAKKLGISFTLGESHNDSWEYSTHTANQ